MKKVHREPQKNRHQKTDPEGCFGKKGVIAGEGLRAGPDADPPGFLEYLECCVYAPFGFMFLLGGFMGINLLPLVINPKGIVFGEGFGKERVE